MAIYSLMKSLLRFMHRVVGEIGSDLNPTG